LIDVPICWAHLGVGYLLVHCICLQNMDYVYFNQTAKSLKSCIFAGCPHIYIHIYCVYIYIHMCIYTIKSYITCASCLFVLIFVSVLHRTEKNIPVAAQPRRRFYKANDKHELPPMDCSDQWDGGFDQHTLGLYQCHGTCWVLTTPTLGGNMGYYMIFF
jgi:hypothetical protein